MKRRELVGNLWKSVSVGKEVRNGCFHGLTPPSDLVEQREDDGELLNVLTLFSLLTPSFLFHPFIYFFIFFINYYFGNFL